MKKIVFFLLVTGFINSSFSQNEFANQKFYDAFRKIYADADSNFLLYRSQETTKDAYGYNNYKVKLMLPGAKSAKIRIDHSAGLGYAEYWFSDDFSKEQPEQKRKNLIAAIEVAVGKKFYEVVDSSFSSVSYNYFLTPNPGNIVFYKFKCVVYLSKNTYDLILTIRSKGKVIPDPNEAKIEIKKKSTLVAEKDLDKKILAMWNDAENNFNSYKGDVESRGKNWTTYKTKQTLFGSTGLVHDFTLECMLVYPFSSTELGNLDDANNIYEQLKSSLVRVLRDKITFRAETQSKDKPNKYIIHGIENNNSESDWKQSYIRLVIERDKNYPGIILTFRKYTDQSVKKPGT